MLARTRNSHIYQKYCNTLTSFHTCLRNLPDPYCHLLMCLKTAGRMENSKNPDQTPLSVYPSLFIPILWVINSKILTQLKCCIFLKNRHFIIQERFNKLTYGINTICGIWQPVKFQLVNWIKNETIFNRISELMLATSVQRYDKISFHFLSSLRTRD